MPTVGDLIHSLDKDAVLVEALPRLYTGAGESAEGYENVWAVLKELQPKLTKTSVLLSARWSIDDPPQHWVDVSGVEEGDPQHWAIEFVSWDEWLSMPIIVADELQPMPDAEQLAHCLYEMTWAGYTQTHIQDRMDEINDRMEEVQESLRNDQITH